MPRIRSIHPDIVDDDVVAALTPGAFRTWVLLWTHLDDAGRGIDSAKLWAGKLYPLNDAMTTEAVERDLDELASHGLIVRYEVDGKRYLCVKVESWPRYQKPQHPTPSKLPPVPPPESLMRNAGAAHPGVEVEGSCIEEEGESEGEVERPRRPQAVPRSPALEAKAIAAGERMGLLPIGETA